MTIAFWAAVAAVVVLAVLLGRAVGGAHRAALSAAEAARDLEAARREAEALRAEGQRAVENARAEGERRLEDSRRAAREQLEQAQTAAREQLEQERAAMGERFKALATDVLRATADGLNERSRQSLETVLAPVRTSLETFTKDFKDAYSVENTERLSLRESLQALAELNRRVSEDTRHLTRALQGNTRWQGRWGEMVLKNILEASGLEEGRGFSLQVSATDEAGDRLRPDAVVNCPDSRRLIIDSKVVLTSYLKYTQSVDDTERAALLREHVRAIETQYRHLADKSYQTRLDVRAADFVLMFVPHEGAYLAAVDSDPDIWMRAFDSHVIIVSPAHLVTVIKLVEQMWTDSDRNANAAAIAEEAGRLLDKLRGFLADMEKVGDTLEKARGAYDAALSKLSTGRGSVLSRHEKMRRLGAKAGPLPEKYLREIEPDEDAAQSLPE